MIDSEIQKELCERYSPKGSQTKKIQNCVLQILKYVAKVCDDNNLRYWLASGTLLGAVRHGGFIPWDDDLDIEMPYEDFKKLRAIMLNDKNYFWQDHSTDKLYMHYFGKVKIPHMNPNPLSPKKSVYDGAFIDVFPIESMPHCFSELSYRLIGWNNYQFLWSDSNFLSKFSQFRFAFGEKALFPMLRGLSRICYHKEYHHTYGVGFVKKRNLTSLSKLTKMTFEGELFSVPEEYDAYLRYMFGEDYMELPPEDKRVVHQWKLYKELYVI